MPSDPPTQATHHRVPTAVVDMDGVIAKGSVEDVYSDAAGWAYEKCLPITPGIRMLEFLRAQQIRIVLHTARWEEDREKTVAWLKRHEIPFDELVMGKPSGEVYIDDRNWPGTLDPYQLYGELGYLLETIKTRYKERT